jgi:hypothetical protein
VDMKCELALSSFRRCHGKHTGILSDWAAFLGKRASVTGRYVISIGVGSGGAAVAFLEAGAKKVMGVDLRDSFPVIPQRENSYIPPEVACHSRRDDFVWSPHVWRNGGDVRTLELPDADFDVVVDLDWAAEDLIKILPRLLGTGKIYIRVKACNHYLRHLIDALPDPLIVRMSRRPQLERHVYMIECNRYMPNLQSANYMNITVTSNKPSDYVFKYNKDDVKDYVCNQLRMSPGALCGVDKASLSDKRTSLRALLGSLPDSDEKENCARQVDALSEILTMLDQFFLWTPSELASVSSLSIRCASRILGEVLSTRSNIIDNLMLDYT